MKKGIFVIFSAFFFSVNFLSAQLSDTLWTKTMGGSAYDVVGTAYEAAAHTVVDSLGNVYIATHTNSIDKWVNDSLGGTNIWLLKLNSDGDTLWTRVFGGRQSDVARSILLHKTGFYICGYTWSNDNDLTGHYAGDTTDVDGFIAKFDADGNTIWAKQYGGGAMLGASGSDKLIDIIETKSGNLMAIGTTTSNNGDLYFTSNIFHAAWMLHVDTAGTILHSRKIAGANHSEYNLNYVSGLVEFGAVNRFVLFGEQFYSNTFTEKFWLVQFDLNGTKIWEQELGGPADNYASSITTIEGKNLYITGWITAVGGDIDTTGYHGGYSEVFLAKLDSSGNLVKQKLLGGSESENIYAMRPDPNGNLVLSGFSRSLDGDLSSVDYGGADFWIVSLDSNLDTVFSHQFGGDNVDIITDIGFSGDTIYAVGYTESDSAYVIGNNGYRDLYAAKFINYYRSLDSKNIENTLDFEVFPNPTADFIKIQGFEESMFDFEIYDLCGKLMTEGNLKGNSIIDLTVFETGVYILTIEKEGKHFSKRIIKL